MRGVCGCSGGVVAEPAQDASTTQDDAFNVSVTRANPRQYGKASVTSLLAVPGDLRNRFRPTKVFPRITYSSDDDPHQAFQNTAATLPFTSQASRGFRYGKADDKSVQTAPENLLSIDSTAATFDFSDIIFIYGTEGDDVISWQGGPVVIQGLEATTKSMDRLAATVS